MTSFLKSVRKKFESSSLRKGKLRKRGCSVEMANLPKRKIVVDLDKAESRFGKSDRRCDYLLVAETNMNEILVVLLELMRGDLDVKKVFGQLQASARTTEKLVPSDTNFKFFPVVATGAVKKGGRSKFLKLEDMSIRFHSAEVTIRRMKCDTALVDKLG